MDPLGSETTVNVPLQLVATAYIQDASEFIADKVFPVINVQKRSSNYYTFDRSSWYRSDAHERAPATVSVGGGFTMSQAPLYNCRVYAFHKDIDDQTRAEHETNGLIDIEQVSTRFVTRQLLLKRELVWAATYFATGVWGRNLTGVAGAPAASQVRQWSDAASTPIDDIQNESLRVLELTGLEPNTLVITPRVQRALRRNPQVLDAAKAFPGASGGGAPNVTDQMLADALGIDRIVVAKTIVNNAPEGAADIFAPLYGRHALLVHTPPAGARSIEMPAGGYIFTWDGYDDAGGFNGERIVSFRIPEIRSDRVEGEMAFDMRQVAPDLGVFFANVIP